MSDCADLYPVLGHSFQDKKLLKQALTLGFSKHFSGYERLEFLGDRVLGVSVAEMLFTNYPREPEGDMARRFVDLTRAETLADIARDLRFDRYLILAEPKNKPELTKAVLSDVCEAVIAALYLDGGFDVARAFVAKYWTEPMKRYQVPPVDSKTKLQEWTQAKKLPLPVYTELDRTGPAHAPVFVMRVAVEGYPPAEAKGASKREASQTAAAELLERVAKNG